MHRSLLQISERLRPPENENDITLSIRKQERFVGLFVMDVLKYYTYIVVSANGLSAKRLEQRLRQ